MNDDFYVGYLPKAPAGLGKKIRRLAIGLVLAACVAGAVLILDQPPYAASRFEYGNFREYAGVIDEWPYPILQTGEASFLLVAPGKHGLANAVKGLQGKSVRLQGALIERAEDRMLEVRPESLRETAPVAVPARELLHLGAVKLRGEIVDSKCYLGVMNPGDGKVHRDCAVRCISGGAPPAFVARDDAGNTRVLLLTGSDGRQLHGEVLSFVAEPLEITGELVRYGSNVMLKAEPSQFRRESE
jgi:hypothetical protein